MSRMENIIAKLDDINKTLRELTEVVRKPKENRFIRVLEYLVLIGGASALLGSIDIIRRWFLGG
jgi:hypothetical protein